MSVSQEVERIVHALNEHSASGCAIALHIHFTTPEYLYQSYSKSWTAIYPENGYVMHDPTVAWAFQNTGAKRWSDLAAQDEMEIYHKAKAYGITYGFACAVEDQGTRSVAGFARPDREFTDAEMTLIAADFLALHQTTANTGSTAAALRDVFRQLSVQFGRP